MKQITQNYKNGEISLDEVNVPALSKGGILVRTHFSLISLGTEGMKVHEGKLSYLGKAQARPDQVRKVLDSVRQQGVMATYQKVMNKLDSLTPLGYSLSGIIERVAPDVNEFRVGDRVACAGAGYANHAEYNFLPKNLAVKVPENVSLEDAAYTTVGAIAMQGYRQSQMMVDENACVIGLGLLGQLLTQILVAGGINVIGVDPDESKCIVAREQGAVMTLSPSDPELTGQIRKMTDGKGVDCVFISASGTSNNPVETAVEVARDRARVIVIGKTKLDLDWKTYYEKELDVRFSRSYGPGRYDPNYEEMGIDYPVGYVRWTEKRNMESFLNLIDKNQIHPGKLTGKIVSFNEAVEVFNELSEGNLNAIGVLLKYDIETAGKKPAPSQTITKETSGKKIGKANIGFIGAGNYASSMLLPFLKSNTAASLNIVATTKSLSARNAVRKFGFQNSTTDYSEMLNNEAIDTIFIVTRHKTHARLVVEALNHEKNVFVEKPLAITKEGIIEVRNAILETGNSRILVGFNRRFSAAIRKTAGVWKNSAEIPLMAHYRINAGKMEQNSWYLDPTEGTRFVGEGGHFIDTLTYIFQSRPIKVFARAFNGTRRSPEDQDNLSAILEYENGSVAQIQYLTGGGAGLPKEYLEVHGDGKSVVMNNFKSLRIFQGRKSTGINFRKLDKGQEEEMKEFVSSVVKSDPMPIPVDDIIDTTLATLAINESLITNQVVDLRNYLEA